MTKKINVIIQENGNEGFSFDGFEGDSCFTEADEITRRLKILGVEISAIEIESKYADSAPKIRQSVKNEE